MAPPLDRALPDGTVTFLFTDIEGSTRLMAAGSGLYEQVLDLHHDLLRDIWREHAGHEVNTEGDSFFVAFASADDGLRAAIAAQRALAATFWPAQIDLRVRMGLHTGFARPHRGDYNALAVNRAARVVGAAHGGQILLSDDTRAALTDVHTGTEIAVIGSFRVRDFDGATMLHRVVADGWVDDQRPPRVRPADGHNLVRPLTSLVNRVEERRTLTELAKPGMVVSVVGPGGVGKTRLVIEVGLEVVDAWRDGVWFVDLEPVRSNEHLASAIAQAIGATLTPGRPSIEDVLAHLEARTMLLVLDNCEHVSDAVAAMVGGLLAACPELGILVTSRRPLGLRAEAVVRLGALSNDHPDGPAVTLFLERAVGIAVDDMPVVFELCEQLDGLPLAIELAAARTTAVGPAQILASVRESHAVLRSRDPTLPERHRSLDRLLDSARDLLDEPTQAVLRRLAVFDGGFDLRLARTACDHGDMAIADVAECLWALTDHALVVADEAAGQSRYRLPRMVRSYATSLDSPQDAARTAGALGQLYLARLGPMEATNRRWLGEMAMELDNLRGVIAALAEVDPATALQLAWSVGRFHEISSAYATGIDETTRHVALLTEPHPARVGLLTLLADLHLRTGDVAAGSDVLTVAAALHADVGPAAWDEAGLARSQGEVALRLGRLDEAETWAREALEHSVAPRSRSRAWSLLGIVLGTSGDLTGSIEAFEQDLTASRLAGNDTFLAKTHGNLAETHVRLGNRVEAARHQLACLDLARAHGETSLVAYSVMLAAQLSAQDADFDLAVTLDRAARVALQTINHELYEDDRQRSEQLLELSGQALGPAAYARASERGAGLSLARAADEAEHVLMAARHGNSEESTRQGQSWHQEEGTHGSS